MIETLVMGYNEFLLIALAPFFSGLPYNFIIRFDFARFHGRLLELARQVHIAQGAEPEVWLLANGCAYASLHVAEHGDRFNAGLDDFFDQHLGVWAGA